MFQRKGLRISEEKIKTLTTLPEGYVVGKAVDDGGCFFDSLAQAINIIKGTNYNEKSMRMLCHKYYMANKENVRQWNRGDRSRIVDDEYCLIQYTNGEMDELFNGRDPLWGRPHIEGRMICHELNLEGIYLIEIMDLGNNQLVAIHQFINAEELEPLRPERVMYKDEIPVLINFDLHFVPVLPLHSFIQTFTQFSLEEHDLEENDMPIPELTQSLPRTLLGDQQSSFIASGSTGVQSQVSQIGCRFEESSSYSDELNEQIRKFNRQLDSFNQGGAAARVHLGMALRYMSAIYDRVSDDNAGGDSEFINQNYQSYNSTKEELCNFYNFHFLEQSNSTEHNIFSGPTSLFQNLEMRPPPQPAEEIEPPRVVDTDNVEESEQAKNWKYVSYGLYCVSFVTGVAGAGTVASGVSSLVKESTKEVAKETVKRGAAKTIVAGGGLLATSALTGYGGYATGNQTDNVEVSSHLRNG